MRAAVPREPLAAGCRTPLFGDPISLLEKLAASVVARDDSMARSAACFRSPPALTPSLALTLIVAGIAAASLESGGTPQCARHYCNTEGIVLHGAEGAFVRANLSLDKVIVMARHGDRFIMSYTRLGRLTAPRLSCRPVATAANSTVESEPSLASFRADAMAIGPVSDGSGGLWPYPPYPNAPLCGPAHLTPAGVQQLLRLGAYLRAAYVGRLGAGGSFRVAEVTSTDYRRTFQSALALLHAIEGGNAFAADRAPIVIRRVAAEHQNLCALSNCSCPSLDDMRRRVNAEVAARGRRSDVSHAEFVRRARHVLGARHARPDYPWKVALDFLMQFACRARPLPCYRTRCFLPSHVDSLWNHLSHYFAELSTLPAFVRRSRIEMHPLLEDFARVLSSSGDVPRGGGGGGGGLYLYLGHDSSLVPLAVSLGLRIDSWPQYAARLVIELYSSAETTSAVDDQRPLQRQRFLRFLYDGRDVTADVHVCKRPLAPGGDEAGLCPVERLLEFVRYNMRELGFADWRSACDEPQLDP